MSRKYNFFTCWHRSLCIMNTSSVWSWEDIINLPSSHVLVCSYIQLLTLTLWKEPMAPPPWACVCILGLISLVINVQPSVQTCEFAQIFLTARVDVSILLPSTEIEWWACGQGVYNNTRVCHGLEIQSFSADLRCLFYLGRFCLHFLLFVLSLSWFLENLRLTIVRT